MKTAGRVRVVERRTTGDALAEGPTLLPLVRNMAERDQVAWLAVVVRRERIELLDPRPFVAVPQLVARFMAGLTRSEVPDGGPALAVGLIGNLQVRAAPSRNGPRPPLAPVAVAFLEAPNCDWWLWQRFLGLDDIEDPEQELAGRHGDALPNGLGRWWSLGRRTGVRVQLERLEPAPPPPSALIH